jgi:hypothetical protein
MFNGGGGGVVAQEIIIRPVMGRPDRPVLETSSATGADIVQHAIHAVSAKSAFVTADACLGRIRRQRLVAVFAGGSEFKHGCILLLATRPV